MNDELKVAIRQYLKENLTVEVVNPDCTPYGEWPAYPTVKVRILLEGETISEDSADFPTRDD